MQLAVQPAMQLAVKLVVKLAVQPAVQLAWNPSGKSMENHPDVDQDENGQKSEKRCKA